MKTQELRRPRSPSPACCPSRAPSPPRCGPRGPTTAGRTRWASATAPRRSPTRTSSSRCRRTRPTATSPAPTSSTTRRCVEAPTAPGAAYPTRPATCGWTTTRPAPRSARTTDADHAADHDATDHHAAHDDPADDDHADDHATPPTTTPATPVPTTPAPTTPAPTTAAPTTSAPSVTVEPVDRRDHHSGGWQRRGRHQQHRRGRRRRGERSRLSRRRRARWPSSSRCRPRSTPAPARAPPGTRSCCPRGWPRWAPCSVCSLSSCTDVGRDRSAPLPDGARGRQTSSPAGTPPPLGACGRPGRAVAGRGRRHVDRRSAGRGRGRRVAPVLAARRDRDAGQRPAHGPAPTLDGVGHRAPGGRRAEPRPHRRAGHRRPRAVRRDAGAEPRPAARSAGPGVVGSRCPAGLRERQRVDHRPHRARRGRCARRPGEIVGHRDPRHGPPAGRSGTSPTASSCSTRRPWPGARPSCSARRSRHGSCSSPARAGTAPATGATSSSPPPPWPDGVRRGHPG